MTRVEKAIALICVCWVLYVVCTVVLILLRREIPAPATPPASQSVVIDGVERLAPGEIMVVGIAIGRNGRMEVVQNVTTRPGG